MARGRGAPSAFAARTGGGGALLRSFGGGDDLDLLEPALPPPAAAAAAGYRAGESPARGALAAGCYVDDARARASPRLEAVGSRSKPLGAAAEPETAYNRLYTTRDLSPQPHSTGGQSWPLRTRAKFYTMTPGSLLQAPLPACPHSRFHRPP